ncbi:MAG TPA: haloacid dehalogenase-like hydrolase [Polyangia bacterium]|nr:haloacid dehalogenase-like hydrolase [Polyangia bacterium]
MMILVSDFDGTATLDDVTTFLWDRHLSYDWRRELLPPTHAGQMSPLEMIARGYGDIPVGPEALLAEARANTRLRPGLEALTGHCRARGWPFIVLSHGLAFYIQALLPPDVAFTSFVGSFAGGRWQVTLPPGVRVRPGEDFKSRVVADLRARHPGHATVYLGDGRLDLPAAETCDRVFAVRGSRLAELCPRALPFDALDEVVAALEVG